MPRRLSRLARISFITIAVLVALALLQITRHGLQATDSRRAAAAHAALNRPVCSAAPARSELTPAATTIAVRLDYAGAEALIDALERDSLSEADVDSLLRIHGVCAMVDNVPRFFPEVGTAEFRQEIRTFVRTKKPGDYDDYFRLSNAWRARSKVRALIAAIRANDRAITADAIAQLERYRPDTGAIAITAYFVAGGVSDGFAFEDDPASLYANLVTADDDVSGVVLNIVHEAYHAMQFRAMAHASRRMPALSAAADTTPPVERLFATTLAEGTASYVADPTRATIRGANIEQSRERYRRNAEPKRMAENFARFDAVLKALKTGRMTWEKAYTEGFTSQNDASFYFVGYEMARATEQYCGRECIGKAFAEPPVEFFRRYVALYRAHPELRGRFSAETESIMMADGTTPGR